MFSKIKNVIWNTELPGTNFNSEVVPYGSTDPKLYGRYKGHQYVKARHSKCNLCNRSTRYLVKPDKEFRLKTFDTYVDDLMICTGSKYDFPWAQGDITGYLINAAHIFISKKLALWNWEGTVTALLFENPCALLATEDNMPPELDIDGRWVPVSKGSDNQWVLLGEDENYKGTLDGRHIPNIDEEASYEVCPICLDKATTEEILIELVRPIHTHKINDYRFKIQGHTFDASVKDVWEFFDRTDGLPGQIRTSFEELSSIVLRKVIVKNDFFATMKNIENNTFVKELFSCIPSIFTRE